MEKIFVGKRFIYLLFFAVMCSKVAVADNYAILVSAGKATTDGEFDNSEYWYDLYLIYEYLLLWEHYDSAKVYVFYGDGNDFNTSIDRYKKTLHNWGQITDYSNSYSTLSSVIPSLNNVITDDDNLLFYCVAGHGIKAGPWSDDTYFALINYNQNNPDDPNTDSVSKSQLVNMINSITHYNKRKIFWMTCNSGAMGGGLINPNNNKTVLVTSSYPDVDSYAMEDSTHLPHSEFNFVLYCISTGLYPHSSHNVDMGSVCSVLQNNSDSIISIYELFNGMNNFNYADFLYLYSCLFDVGGISNKIFIGEDKELKDVTIDSNSSYWLDKMEVSEVELESDIDVIIDVDEQCVIKKNTFVPVGTTLLIK